MKRSSVISVVLPIKMKQKDVFNQKLQKKGSS